MPEVTVGTFNIRLFPDRGTVAGTVASRIAELDADAFMVQEIRDPAAFDDVLALASVQTSRDYVAVLGPMCASSQLELGVVYDRRRFSLHARRVQAELDPQARCSCRDGHPPALLAVLDTDDGSRLTAMSVHLQFGARRWQYRARREQWEELVASIERVEAQFGGTLAVAGDFNSTGYAEDERGERAFIHDTAREAGLVVATAGLSCTAYWQPNRRTRDYVPSTLDHILLRHAPSVAAEAMGMCAAPRGGQRIAASRGCPDYHEVSDHCPVRLRIAL